MLRAEMSLSLRLKHRSMETVMSKLSRYALLLTLCSVGLTPHIAQAANAAPARDCQDVGADVSALIDASRTLPELPVARAAFQHGLMLCMDGNDRAANDLYDQATEILTGEKPKAPAPPPDVAVVGCDQTGAEVSSLIDTSALSPNLANARAAFQRGIMECMQGDDAAANEQYLTAKTLLAGS